MKGKTVFIIIFFSMLFIACGNKNKDKIPTQQVSSHITMTGDSTLYGLACEGCSDSVVVFLPEDGSDPVTYNILEAHRKGHVLGKLKIGDKIEIIPNHSCSTANLCSYYTVTEGDNVIRSIKVDVRGNSIKRI